MPTQPNLRVAELDFDQILANLVEFMKDDPEFTDYNFAGSGLRLLARVLAYVTFYNGVYLSSAVNESFLDTAQLRSSVVSHARMLGYQTQGMKSAKLFVNTAIQLSDTSALSFSLPKNTAFSLQSNSAFVFYNPDSVVFTQNANTLVYEAKNMLLVEGTPSQYRFVVDLTNPTQRFTIPNANVDYSTLKVRVFTSTTDNTETLFTAANSYVLIEPTDPVFWVEESYNGYPELRFGNGVIGQPLSHGNLILAEFLVSKGTDANGIRGPFKILSSNVAGFLTGATDIDANSSSSSGGTLLQDIDEIRALAPSVYQAQNRCVTASDFKAILLRDYGEHISAINVFGGEEGDPNDSQTRPVLGKVFVAVKPKVGLRFTTTIKDHIAQNILKPFMIVGTIPEVIDPDYTYVVVSTLVKYDPKSLTITKTELQDEITNNILAFTETNVEKFDTQFRFSRLTRVIDDSDDAILSSLTRLDLEKRIVPTLGMPNQATLKFGVPLKTGNSIIIETQTNKFAYKDTNGDVVESCFLQETANAVHVVRRLSNGTITTVKSNIGVADPSAGLISLTNFIPESIENDAFDVRVRVRPAVNDFAPKLNLLYTLDANDVYVILQTDATVTPDDQAAFFQGGIL